MLIHTTEGVINTAHIVRAEALSGHPGRSSVTFADGSERVVDAPLFSFEQACGAIVPAQRGFWVISAILPGRDEEGIVYGEEAVIAFRIGHGDPYDAPIPVTVSGEPSTIGGMRWTILQPNGRCFGPDHIHESVADFKADCERSAARDGSTK